MNFSDGCIFITLSLLRRSGMLDASIWSCLKFINIIRMVDIKNSMVQILLLPTRSRRFRPNEEDGVDEIGYAL